MPTGIYKRTEYHKQKQRKGMLGHVVSVETRKKISVANSGKHNSPNTQFKKGHKKGMIGKKHSPKTIEKMKVSGEKTTPRGSESPFWKGGKPKCVVCNVVLTYKAQRCKKHAPQTNKGNFKHGLSHTPAYKSFYTKSRQRAKEAAFGSHDIKEWNELKKKFNYMCLCCKQQEPFIKLTEDHVVPLSMGGSDNIENIQPLCLSCNSKKWATVIDYRINTYEQS